MKNDLQNISIKDLAILVSSELKKHGIDAVLVGGACVSIYSNNKYISGDLDYVSPALTDNIKEALKNIGFFKKGEFRQFFHDKCPFFIEFPPGPIAIGNEVPITNFNEIKSLKLFTPTDCVKDRLAAFYNWNDLQSLDQALMVAKAQQVNLNELERWSKGEGSIDKYKRFLILLKNKDK
jgi:hypothetical protein